MLQYLRLSPRFVLHSTPTTEIYTLSLHDALPISSVSVVRAAEMERAGHARPTAAIGELPSRNIGPPQDRKSTRLNSSHANISYAVFCLKKKKKKKRDFNSIATPEK